MESTKGYKFRIYPNKTQTDLINRTLGSCRFVYNYFLTERRDSWNIEHTSITYNQTAGRLTLLKRYDEYSWLKEVDSMALQEALRNLDASFQNFFQRRAKYPRYKSKRNHFQSYRTRNQNNGIRIVGNRIKLPKIGLVKAKLSREFDGRILNATISRAASGKYYVSLCVEEKINALPNGGRLIGIDVGLKEFYTDSNGNSVANPRILRRLSRKLAREQRKLACKMPSSKNRELQRVRVARVHERIADIRKDFLHQLSTRLVRENQTIAVERLRVKNMMRNHKLAKAISDVSWSEFFRMLEYKAKSYGGEVLKVDTFYPSSQTCHVCGYQNKIIKNLSVRKWTCPECGMRHDRDVNAARNILAKALEHNSVA